MMIRTKWESLRLPTRKVDEKWFVILVLTPARPTVHLSSLGHSLVTNHVQSLICVMCPFVRMQMVAGMGLSGCQFSRVQGF